MTRVLIADDHPLFRDAIRGVVAQVFADFGWEFSCVEAATVGEAMRVAEGEEELDLLLLDLYMPGAQGLSQLVALRSKVPATPIIVLSSLSDPQTVSQCLTCGAAGCRFSFSVSCVPRYCKTSLIESSKREPVLWVAFTPLATS